MTRLTAQKASKLGIEQPKKRNKYNAKKVTVDGFEFASRKEADYYCELKLRLKAGDIKGFSLQPEFVLQEAFTDSMGNKHRAIKYTADFKVIHNDLSVEIVEVKGHKTRDYLLRKKLFLKRYPEFRFTEV